jgi:hypothetical protein
MDNFKPDNFKLFKLSSGEEVNASAIEKLIQSTCHYVKYAVVGENKSKSLVAFIFPNDSLFHLPDYKLTANDGCFCPRSLNELGKCLSGCLKSANEKITDHHNQIKEAILMNSDIDSDEGPMISYHEIIRKYKTLLQTTYGSTTPPEHEIYFMKNI